MNNAEKFKEIFKEFATEVWAFPEKDFLIWLNAEYEEPTTKNDLGVDKFDKAINQSDLEEWIMETFPDWCEGDVRLIMNHMDEMPSVTPQPRKGHWIAFDSDEDKYDEIKCDCCKKNFTVDAYHWTDIGFTKDDLNFCPNCGADMREVEE